MFIMGTCFFSLIFNFGIIVNIKCDNGEFIMENFLRKSVFLAIALLFVLGLSSCSQSSQIKKIIKNTKSASFAIYMYDEFGCPKGSGSGIILPKI